ncbi:hypothetical protein [Methylobacterium nigriterrae]|uniref:hypothetical protein n=1 Tax=Methylobacterium nigriterrae TaxID=3127512 RepID=UPI0030133203
MLQTIDLARFLIAKPATTLAESALDGSSLAECSGADRLGQLPRDATALEEMTHQSRSSTHFTCQPPDPRAVGTPFLLRALAMPYADLILWFRNGLMTGSSSASLASARAVIAAPPLAMASAVSATAARL